MLELKIYIVKICWFTGQGWKSINFLGESIFFTGMTIKDIFKPDKKTTRSVTFVCAHSNFTKRTELISDDMNSQNVR